MAAASGLSLLTVAVTQGWLDRLDHALLHRFAALRGAELEGLFQAITWLGSGYVLIPAALLLMLFLATRRQWRLAALLGLTYAGAALSAWALKQAIGRERPLLHPALADFVRFDWSFPSGHATHAAALALGLWLLARETGAVGRWLPLLALAVVLGVALSRLYLQVHWPSDVLAGVLLATVWAGLVSHVLRPRALRMDTP